METKEIIVRKALEKFLRNGYDCTSMNMIADEVGITKPAIYHHFESKESLAESVIAYFEEKVTAWTRGQHSKFTTFDEYLRFVITSIPVFDRIECMLLDVEPTEEFTMGFNDLCGALARDSGKIRMEIDRIFKQTQRFLHSAIAKAQAEKIVRDDVDPETLAITLHGIVEGMSVLHKFDCESDHDEQVEKIYQALHTLLKPHATEES